MAGSTDILDIVLLLAPAYFITSFSINFISHQFASI
jgi:hypothetical protein